MAATKSLIKPKDAEALRERFATDLVHPIQIDLFVRPARKIIVAGRPDCEYCEEATALMEEIAALSPLMTVSVHDVDEEPTLAEELGVSDVPTTVLSGQSRGKVRYMGIPIGYEFSAFLEDLVDVSRGKTDLTEETREALEALDKDVSIKVFVTPTCPYCPAPARLAHKMAIESERVIADVVAVNEFPAMGRKYQVQGVPKTVFNDQFELVGAYPEHSFVTAIKQATA